MLFSSKSLTGIFRLETPTVSELLTHESKTLEILQPSSGV